MGRCQPALTEHTTQKQTFPKIRTTDNILAQNHQTSRGLVTTTTHVSQSVSQSVNQSISQSVIRTRVSTPYPFYEHQHSTHTPAPNTTRQQQPKVTKKNISIYMVFHETDCLLPIRGIEPRIFSLQERRLATWPNGRAHKCEFFCSSTTVYFFGRDHGISCLGSPLLTTFSALPSV